MDKKERTIILIAAVVAILAALAIAPQLAHDKGIVGEYYVSEVTVGVFEDAPSQETRSFTEEDGMFYSFSDLTDDTVTLNTELEEPTLLAFNGSLLYTMKSVDGDTYLFSGKVIDKNNVTISMLSSVPGYLNAVSFVLTRCGTEPSAVPDTVGFHLEAGETIVSTNVANNVGNPNTDPSDYTLKYICAGKGMIFYQTTAPETDGPINCLGISYGEHSFLSMYDFNGSSQIDFVYSDNGYINLSSAEEVQGGSVLIEVWTIDFVWDNRALVYPDIDNTVYNGTQWVYDGSGMAVEKNLTIMPEQHSKNIVTMNNSFGQDRSVWGATIVPLPNGDYRLNIFAIFDEEGISYRGLYTSNMSSDLSRFVISCMAVSEEGKTVISFGDTQKKNVTDDGKSIIGTYTPVKGSVASYDSEMKPVVSEISDIPSFEILSVDNCVLYAKITGYTCGGVYDGDGAFVIGAAFKAGGVTKTYKYVCSFDQMSGMLTVNTFAFTDDGTYMVRSCEYMKDGYVPINDPERIQGGMGMALPITHENNQSPVDEFSSFVKGDVYHSYEAFSLIDETYTDRSNEEYVYEVVDVIGGFYFTTCKVYDGNAYLRSYEYIAVNDSVDSYLAFCYNNGTPFTDNVTFRGDALLMCSSSLQGGKLATWAVNYTKNGSLPKAEIPVPDLVGKVFEGTDYDVFSNGNIFDSATEVTLRNQNGNMLRMDILSGDYTSDWTAIVIGGAGYGFISASTFEYNGETFHGTYKGTFSMGFDALRITGIAYGENQTMVYIIFDLKVSS